MGTSWLNKPFLNNLLRFRTIVTGIVQLRTDRQNLQLPRRKSAHHRFRLADGHGVVDGKPQADIMPGIARLQFVAKATGGLQEGLCIPQPRLDFPEPVVA